MKRTTAVLVAAIILASAFTTVTAQESGDADADAKRMESWEEAIAPGEHHAALQALVGEWKIEIKLWQAPGSESQVSAGQAVNEMILGGRQMAQSLEATLMGVLYKGMGLYGYDNLTGKHTLVWVDNLSTSVTLAVGDCSEDQLTMTHHAQVKNAATGADMNVKLVTRIIDSGNHVFEYWVVGTDGDEFKSLAIAYQRD